ncbi:M48 family metallopeptidase [Hellea sp.]|nr:M48 family metallopeptidase [Hellea sp.]
MRDTENRTSLGEIIYGALSEQCIIETEKWAIERIENIMRKFENSCELKKDYKVIIPWLNEFTAFTTPGDYIFFARKLFQECSTEAMAAFVIAHEISHHKLGHLDKFPETFSENKKAEIQIFIASIYRAVESRIHGPEQECDADRLAIEMCILAGYNPFECLKLFDKLEKIALDKRAFGAVFGPDESDDELLPDAPTVTKVKIWLYQRRLGYLPIRDRRQMILHHLAEKGIYEGSFSGLSAA